MSSLLDAYVILKTETLSSVTSTRITYRNKESTIRKENRCSLIDVRLSRYEEADSLLVKVIKLKTRPLTGDGSFLFLYIDGIGGRIATFNRVVVPSYRTGLSILLMYIVNR